MEESYEDEFENLEIILKLLQNEQFEDVASYIENLISDEDEVDFYD